MYSSIPKQHPHFKEEQGGCRNSIPDNQEYATKPCICYQYGKVTKPGNSDDRVPRVHNQCEGDEIQTSSGESKTDNR